MVETVVQTFALSCLYFVSFGPLVASTPLGSCPRSAVFAARAPRSLPRLAGIGSRPPGEVSPSDPNDAARFGRRARPEARATSAA